MYIFVVWKIVVEEFFGVDMEFGHLGYERVSHLKSEKNIVIDGYNNPISKTFQDVPEHPKPCYTRLVTCEVILPG